ncbi:hypothetical protein F5884DRAFT_825350 [Xylogone sp. PMI_703]|nr:hypothetical protein F5884DRAFT_825350 [Xylogone sp. PMI_703]
MAVISFLSNSLLACLGFSAIASSSTIGNIALDLQPLLSENAQIYYPGSEGYKNATARWASAVKPGIDVVVKVASEQDVQHTGVIGIWLRGLNGTVLAPGSNGTEAIIQAGALSGEVIKALWELGKEAVAGGCDCTGFVGPMLGGGHGILQGHYGLLADNLVSARLVLANGTAITVSATQHPDLYWALRGAGHNFGVITSFHYRVHDIVPGLDGFATTNFTFTQDKLEDVFTIANQWITAENRPVQLMHYGLFAIRPSVDPKPVVILLVFWQGIAIPSEYTDPLYALNPVSVVEKWVDFGGVNSIAGADANGPDCVEGLGRQLFPTSLYTWDLNNLRTVLDIFATFPPYLTDSLMLLEGYPVNQVQAIPANSTAYPDRLHNILASPLFQKIRSAMLNGTGPLTAYVNYAHGDENNQAVYGHELWRQQKLKSLKKAYDPHNQFSFFEPIRT